MAIKKKVTYSVSYTAGTDTLTTKLNSLLQDIVTLILSQNPGLQILDTITVGSSRWTGAPLYDTRPSNLYSNDYNGRHYESDVIFIGTNEDNICLSFGFFEGQLVIAMNMTPKVEKSITDVWTSKYSLSAQLAFYAIGKASRWFNKQTNNYYAYSIPYTINNNAISFSIIYWNTEYSRGYSFINGGGQSDGVDLILFPTDEGNNISGIGAAIWAYSKNSNAPYRYEQAWSILAFSFSENLIDNPPSIINVNTSGSNVLSNTAEIVTVNGAMDYRMWFTPNNSQTYNTYGQLFGIAHTLGNRDTQGISNFVHSAPMDWCRTVKAAYSSSAITDISNPGSPDGANVSPLVMPYNLPHLSTGQAYIRKMRIPGWNPECKGEIYLLWAPVLTAYQSGDIVEVGNKSYAIITEGAICWAARVS